MSGLYVAKPGVNALTNTNPKLWKFSSDYDTYKFLQILTTQSITVTDFAGTGATATLKSVNIPIPNTFTFSPFFYTYLTDSGSQVSYDYLSTNFSAAYVCANPAGGNLTGYLSYIGGGTSSYTVNFDVYIFGNAI